MVFMSIIFNTLIPSYTKRKRYGQIGSTPCYSDSKVVSAYQNFGPVAPLFFLAKVPFWLLLNTERGVAI